MIFEIIIGVTLGILAADIIKKYYAVAVSKVKHLLYLVKRAKKKWHLKRANKIKD